MRAKRSNPDCLRGKTLDCFVAPLLAMTRRQPRPVSKRVAARPGHESERVTLTPSPPRTPAARCRRRRSIGRSRNWCRACRRR
uniref:Uncharacterized protein n=1 Tax=Bradyrhizobium ottawaense TaxID=931866 RepID=A0A2U8PC61_9BRAD|nr:hypothetical protein CIT37_26855 [Bradyrhizobium ottawaense]